MDTQARYEEHTRRVVFAFAAAGALHPGWVTVEALAALALTRGEVLPQPQPVAAYQKYWRDVHAAALGLRAQGQAFPVVEIADVR
jgi:hypothetical protein